MTRTDLGRVPARPYEPPLGTGLTYRVALSPHTLGTKQGSTVLGTEPKPQIPVMMVPRGEEMGVKKVSEDGALTGRTERTEPGPLFLPWQTQAVAICRAGGRLPAFPGTEQPALRGT